MHADHVLILSHKDYPEVIARLMLLATEAA